MVGPSALLPISLPSYQCNFDARSGVLLHHGAEAGQRGLDVLARTAAHRVVRPDDGGPPRSAPLLIGDREQRLRNLGGPLGEVIAELRAARRGEVRPEGLELGDHAREQGLDDSMVVAGRERGYRLVGNLEPGRGEPGLAGKLMIDERLAVGDYLRLDSGAEP